MQKPLTVTECKWMLIWGPTPPHFHCAWEYATSHSIPYRNCFSFISTLPPRPQKLKIKGICLNCYMHEIEVNELYSIWGKISQNQLWSLQKIPVHTSKLSLHVHVHTHAHIQRVYIARTTDVQLLPTYRCSSVPAPIEFYMIFFF